MIKVFVTGLGCVSASGMNVEEHLDAFRHEKAPLLSEERSRTGENYALARIPLSNDELKQRLSLSPIHVNINKDVANTTDFYIST